MPCFCLPLKPCGPRVAIGMKSKHPFPSGSARSAAHHNDFPAIELDAESPFDTIREFYLYEEPALLGAIRMGDRREARRIINHLLLHIYSTGEERSDLLKGLLLELVVMISRVAVEEGASQAEVLGMRYANLTELSEIEDDEALAAWLRGTLEHLFDTIEQSHRTTLSGAVAAALTHIQEHLSEDLSREDVARKAGVSPGHLSQLLKERTGRSFVEWLREARIREACRLLADPDKTLAEIAADCGFCDQSYFTHVFRRIRGTTPRQYRRGRKDA